MERKYKAYVTGLFGILLFAQAFAGMEPHFFMQLENRSEQNATVSFQPVVGKITLEPALADHTPLASHAKSVRYAVNIEHLSKEGNYNVQFTGKNDCTFNVAYFAPGRPKITMYGLGCIGGGYQLVDNGYTLLLYISEIKKA